MQLKRLLPGLLIVVALQILISGCATSGMTAGGGDGTETTLFIGDRTLASQIAVLDVKTEVNNGLQQAIVTLSSKRQRTLWLRYRFVWFDSLGREVDPSGKPYNPLHLEGKDAVPITSVAPSPEAVEFKVRIQKVSASKIGNIK